MSETHDTSNTASTVHEVNEEAKKIIGDGETAMVDEHVVASEHPTAVVETDAKTDAESNKATGEEDQSEDEFSDPSDVPAEEDEKVATTAEQQHTEPNGVEVEKEAVPSTNAAEQEASTDETAEEKQSRDPTPPDLNGEDETAERRTSPSGSKPSTPVSSKSTQSLAPQVRYMLPIGGPGRRPRTSPRVSSLNNGAGPSALESSRARAMAKFERMIEEEEHDRRQQMAAQQTSRMPFAKTQEDLKQQRPAPLRRLSSSDIPPIDEASTSREPLDTATPAAAALALRRRSNTLAERGERHHRPRTAPAKSQANGKHASNGGDKAIEGRAQLKRLDTSSTMMVDGQMFFLDEDPMEKKNNKLRSESGRRGSRSGGRRLLDRAADISDMSFLSKAMRKPVKARDEPMIYDADELDDIPPPGAYAIHPPSQTRLQEAANLSLFDEDGNLVRFGTIFETQRTLIIFLRHWLCPFCQMFAQSIKNVDPLPLQRADLGLVVVGQGHAHVTKSYKQVMKIPDYVRIFSDPTRKIYHALGMTLRTNDAGPACARPDYQTMGVMKASFKAIKHGIVDMPVRLPGDTKLLGGEFILGPGLDCSFTHRMVTVRGHLDLPRILVQAGCDLSLKTPKDLLNDHDANSLTGRPGSTRSVDRIGARRLARRLARKTHAATPKDILLMKSQRAAKTAAQRGSLNKRARASYEGNVDGVDGKRHTAPRTFDDIDALSSKGRGKLPESMARGFSVGARPNTSSSLPGMTSSAWTQEAVRPYTAASRPPPLPRTSSADAFKAAKARRQFFLNEGLEELYDEEFDGVTSPQGPGKVRELRKRFTDSSAGSLSTASLGRSSSHRTQYQREQQRRQAELNNLLARSSFGSGGLNALQQGGLAYQTSLRQNSSDASLQSASSLSSSSVQHRRTPSTQSLPLTSNIGNRSSVVLGSSTAALSPTTSTDRTASAKRAQGVPLSFFEKKAIDPAHGGLRSPVSRVQVKYDEKDLQSPTSASFGEDTDYKRLPRSAFEPSTQAVTPNDADEKTPIGRPADLPAVDSPPPPPVPPKSPPKSPLRARHLPPSIASRAPVPAPTPAFAAIFAAEEARRRAFSGQDANSAADSASATPKASAEPRLPAVAPSSASNGAGLTALLAGLPPQTQGKTPTQATFAQTPQNPLLQGRQPISDYVRPPKAEGASSAAPRISIEESVVATSSTDQPISRVASEQSGSSFLDDLETVDGFKRQARMSASNDSAFLKSPLTNRSSMGDASRTEDDDEDEDDDDEVYYSNDWEPLHARQNVVPKGLKSPVEPELRPLSFASSLGGSRRSEDMADTEENSPDDDLSENETESEERSGHAAVAGLPLALLGVLSNGAKGLATTDNAVVKRVISRPTSAPTSPTSPTSNGASNGRSGTLSGSARLVHLNRLPRKPPQSAGAIPVTSTGRTLTSFAEEEEEDNGAGAEDNGKTTDSDKLEPAAIVSS